MKSPVSAWYALFRFLYCRPGFLFFIMISTVLMLAGMSLHILLGAPEEIYALYAGLYIFCVLMNGIMVVNIPTQLNLLASRKTFLLAGNSVLYSLLIASAMVLVMSLALAATVYPPWGNGFHFIKATMVIASVCLLGIISSALYRINFLLVIFVIITAVLRPDRVGTVLTYLVDNFNVIIWALMAMVFIVWCFFCRRFKRFGLKKGEPSSHWGNVEFRVDSKESLANMSILGLIPKLEPSSDAQKNYRIMLMESGYRFGSYTLLYTVIVLLLLAAKFLLVIFFPDFGGLSTYISSGLMLILLPSVLTLFGVSNISANLRRLWLVMPGNRRDHMQHLIEQWKSLQLLLTLVFWFPGTVLLAMSGLPWLWLVFFVAFLWIAYSALSYFILLTRLSQASWMPVFRFVIVVLCVLGGVYLWVTKDFLLTSVAAAFMAASIEFLKNRLLRTWQEQNYSELKVMEMGI